MGAINTAGVWANIGTHSTFEFNRTRASTAIASVNIVSAPASNGAAVLLTTANEGCCTAL